MNVKPIIEFKGRNGKIELYKDFIRLDRETVMGFLMQGLKGKKDIYFKSITSIQIKKPGLTAGYLQFSILGGNESKSGAFAAASDENTISFNGKKNYEKAMEIKECIETRINAPVAPPSSSDADEIEKMYSLMEKGIITKKEFENKKKKILAK